MKMPVSLQSLGVVVAVVTATLMAAPPVSAQDVQGSGDYADLPRVEGGRIRAYQVRDNAEIKVPVAAINTLADETTKVKQLQGAITHSDYVIRPNMSSQDVDRHYEAVLRNNGYETVFTCAGISRCGNRMGVMILNDGAVAPIGFADGLFNDHLRVKVARKGSTWVMLHMIQGPDRALVYQAVIEGARELE